MKSSLHGQIILELNDDLFANNRFEERKKVLSKWKRRTNKHEIVNKSTREKYHQVRKKKWEESPSERIREKSGRESGPLQQYQFWHHHETKCILMMTKTQPIAQNEHAKLPRHKRWAGWALWWSGTESLGWDCCVLLVWRPWLAIVLERSSQRTVVLAVRTNCRTDSLSCFRASTGC